MTAPTPPPPHTPGPWTARVDPWGEGGWCVTRGEPDENGEYEFVIGASSDLSGATLSKETADLIARAPALEAEVERLRVLVRQVDPRSFEGQPWPGEALEAAFGEISEYFDEAALAREREGKS